MSGLTLYEHCNTNIEINREVNIHKVLRMQWNLKEDLFFIHLILLYSNT